MRVEKPGQDYVEMSASAYCLSVRPALLNRENNMKIQDYKDSYTEDMECSLLVDYLDELKRKGKIELFSHIAQETYTPYPSVRAKNTKMGVRKGVPDYLIVGNKGILFLEMKRRKGGIVSQAQKTWLDELSCHTFALVANGFDEAKALIIKYLQG